MLFNLVNFGELKTKEGKIFNFIDILCRDTVSKKIVVQRTFIDTKSYNILSNKINDDLDMFTFNIEKYVSFGFNFKNEIALNFYNDLFIADNK